MYLKKGEVYLEDIDPVDPETDHKVCVDFHMDEKSIVLEFTEDATGGTSSLLLQLRRGKVDIKAKLRETKMTEFSMPTGWEEDSE